MLVDQALEAFLENVRVDLSRRDVGMAEELLDRAQVGAAVEEVAREGVAQDVWADALRRDAGGGGDVLEFLGEALTGEVSLGAR